MPNIKRKTWLLSTSVKNPTELEIPYGQVERITISDFVHKDLVKFSMANPRRCLFFHPCSIGSYFIGAGLFTHLSPSRYFNHLPLPRRGHAPVELAGLLTTYF